MSLIAVSAPYYSEMHLLTDSCNDESKYKQEYYIGVLHCLSLFFESYRALLCNLEPLNYILVTREKDNMPTLNELIPLNYLNNRETTTRLATKRYLLQALNMHERCTRGN